MTPRPGCGAVFPDRDGPVHAYMVSSPACRAAFGVVIAREFADRVLMAVHRLSVDAWAAQHPGDGSRRAVRSVGLHLARLMVQLDPDPDAPGIDVGAAMRGFARRKAALPALPPPARYTPTVADVVDAAAPGHHAAAVRRWAAAVWDDWRAQHRVVRDWARQ